MPYQSRVACYLTASLLTLSLAEFGVAQSDQPVLETGPNGVPSTLDDRLGRLGTSAEDAPVDLPELEVTGEDATGGQATLDTPNRLAGDADPGGAMSRLPGANVNRNGPLTPIVQHRGLFGDRLNVRLDGAVMNSACPNEMEPPLHYLSMPRFESVTIHRGIAPVSSGLETLGTTVEAETRDLPFSDSAGWIPRGEAILQAHRVDRGYALGGLVGASNRRHRLQLGGSWDNGDNQRFGDGEIASSAYQRHQLEAGYGLHTEGHQLELAFVRNETGDTGTPALPMDIRFVDTNTYRLDYTRAWAGTTVHLAASDSRVDHRMDNFGLRTPPNPQRRRLTLADSAMTHVALSVAHPLGAGQIEVGLDGDRARNDATIFNPDNAAFFVESFDDVKRDRYGGFLEWTGDWGARWGGELGLRVTRVAMDAEAVDGTPAQSPGGPQVLRDRFNAAPRDQATTHQDAVIELRYRVNRTLAVNGGVARKMRSPSYQERYLWLPLPATAGLADGKRYVGQVDLDPETAYQFELGATWANEHLELAPRAFYRRVEDYIQGTPATDPTVIAVSSANGDPNPLRFSNVDAVFFGVDVPWAVTLTDTWGLAGNLDYVRGKRRDIDDDLFRIAPLNGRIALHYARDPWSAELETVLYAEQNRVSETNEEASSPGYQLLNLRASYRLPASRGDAGRVTVGIDNLLDRVYRPHLNGINRVSGSDVAVGERLPGPGRNLFARVRVPW